MSPEEKELHKIEDIKRTLYERGFDSRTHHRHGVLHNVPHKVDTDWDNTDDSHPIASSKYTKIFKMFFIGAVIFFAIAIAFGIYKFFQGKSVVSSDNIEITVLGSAFVPAGEELPLQVEILNRNNAKLELVDLVVEYPKGANVANGAEMIRLPREAIGTIKPGERIERNKKVVLYGDQGAIRDVTFRLEYHPEGSNAIFSVEKVYPVTISSSPIALSFDGPISASSNQEINFQVSVNLNTTLPTDKTWLKIDYPTGFKFSSSEPKPDLNTYLWDISKLEINKPMKINVSGTLVGQDGDEKVFHVYVGSPSGANQSVVDVVYNSLLHSLNVERPFLETQVLVNGQTEESVSVVGGKVANVDIVWQNNLPTRVLNAELVASLSGNVLDIGNVTPNDGFLDSANKQIIWNRNTLSELAVVDPGAKGRVSFAITPGSGVGSSGNLRDPQIQILVSIKGQESGDTGTTEVSNFTKKVLRLSSNMQIAATAVSAGGSMPPQADRDTLYKISWTLSNSSNNVNNAEARATLPPYVKWGGVLGSSAENVSYNPSTSEVVWKIGTVRAGTGFGGAEREVAFSVVLRPSVSQVGTVPTLMRETVLSGTDAFSNSVIKSTTQPISTYLDNDPEFAPGDERVIR